MTITKARYFGYNNTDITCRELSCIMDELLRRTTICINKRADVYLTVYTCLYLHDKTVMSNMPILSIYVDGLLDIIMRLRKLDNKRCVSSSFSEECHYRVTNTLPYPIYTQQTPSASIAIALYKKGLALKRVAASNQIPTAPLIEFEESRLRLPRGAETNVFPYIIEHPLSEVQTDNYYADDHVMTDVESTLNRIQMILGFITLLDCLDDDTCKSNSLTIYHKIFQLISFLCGITEKMCNYEFSQDTRQLATRHFDTSITSRLLSSCIPSRSLNKMKPQSIDECLSVWRYFFQAIYKLSVSSLSFINSKLNHLSLHWDFLVAIPVESPMYKTLLAINAALFEKMKFISFVNETNKEATNIYRIKLGTAGIRFVLRCLTDFLGVYNTCDLIQRHDKTLLDSRLMDSVTSLMYADDVDDDISLHMPLNDREIVDVLSKENYNYPLPLLPGILASIEHKLSKQITDITATSQHYSKQSFNVCRKSPPFATEAQVFAVLIDVGRRRPNRSRDKFEGGVCLAGVESIGAELFSFLFDVFADSILIMHHDRTLQRSLINILLSRIKDRLLYIASMVDSELETTGYHKKLISSWICYLMPFYALKYFQLMFHNSIIDIRGMKVSYKLLGHLIKGQAICLKQTLKSHSALADCDRLYLPDFASGSSFYTLHNMNSDTLKQHRECIEHIIELLKAVSDMCYWFEDVASFLIAKQIGSDRETLKLQVETDEQRRKLWFAGIIEITNLPLYNELPTATLPQGGDISKEGLIDRLQGLAYTFHLIDRETNDLSYTHSHLLSRQIYQIREAIGVALQNAKTFREHEDYSSLPDISYTEHSLLPLLLFANR